jgi:hypothetical protein
MINTIGICTCGSGGGGSGSGLLAAVVLHYTTE